MHANKISKTIKLIARLRHIFSHLYPPKYLSDTNPIVSYLTYGLISWGNECKTFLDQILVLQKRALRLIYFAETNDHVIHFLLAQKFYLYKLYIVNQLSGLLLCMMWKKRKKSLLLKIFWNFSLEFLVFILNTRASTSEHFHTKESRLNVKRNAFSRVGVKIWNGIPEIIIIIIIKKKTKKSF